MDRRLLPGRAIHELLMPEHLQMNEPGLDRETPQDNHARRDQHAAADDCSPAVCGER